MTIPRPQFDQLAVEHLPALRRVAHRLAGDFTRAEDLVQETFALALRSHRSFNLGDFGIMPWLVRIMRNSNINRAVRERRQPTPMKDDSLEFSALNCNADLPINPEDFQAMDERLVHALSDLPETHRTVMLMWAVQELSYKEIADALSVPLGTVMSRLHRARRRMKLQLKDVSPQSMRI